MSNLFEPSSYGPRFAELLAVDRNRALDTGDPQTTVTLPSVAELFEHATVADHQAAACCVSGLYLLYDRLDESHTISQSIDTREGSFWHGVMHRREGDFSNAKYWFRQVGEHPAFEAVATQVSEIAPDFAAIDGGLWDPFAFVDACQQAVRGGGEELSECRAAQQIEWQCLFDWCYQLATAQD